MRWPDLFFKAKKRPPVDPTPAPAFIPSSEAVQAIPHAQPEPEPDLATPEETAPTQPPVPEKSVEEAMAEADPLRALTQSGSLRLSKRTSTEAPEPAKVEAIQSKEEPTSASPEPMATPTPDKAPETAGSTQISPSTTGLRRRAKLTEVARIVVPPKTEKPPTPPEPIPEPPAAVTPPAFPVAVPAGSVIQPEDKSPEPGRITSAPVVATPPFEKLSDPVEIKAAAPVPAGNATESPSIPEKPPVATAPAPKPESESVPPEKTVPLDQLPAVSAEKKEFILANGERILGKVLSETDDTLYIEHGTLGVLTLPRSQIAKRPVEIILINGDRIVGDIMAETPDTLYVRHASLGMLTVPRSQRSSRVVEAILKDGDRILGEVLAETDTMTVIRSATLGTVSVPHNKVSMLNRKLEQMELKSLPPALKDKSS